MITLAAAATLSGKAGTATAITYTLHGDEVSAGVDTFKTLAQGQLASSTGTLYTVPGSTQALVKQIHLANTTGSDVTGVVLYTGGTAAGNQLTGTMTILANGTAVYNNGEWKSYSSSGAVVGTVVVNAAGVSYAGGPTLVAANVEDALDELSTEKVDKTFSLATTAPLTGGGDLSANRTLAISAATTSAAGSFAAADKKKLDNAWFDATNYGFVGDDSTDNASAWTTLKAALTTNCVVFFPPGTYRLSSAMLIDMDKHVRFTGAGSQRSVLKTTSTTDDIFRIAATAWYNTFEDLGFATSVTKTAGAAIYINSASAVGTDVRRCAFTSMFYGIYASGAQAANESVWDSLAMSTPATNGSQIKIDGSTINLVISNSTINSGGGGTGTKGVEINQCGAIQIVGCDIIQGANSLHINATSIVSAVFVTNTFFDQATGSTVKISGTSVASRIKLLQCGIAAGAVGTHAVEIASTGTGAAGTSTAQASGVDIIDCDIYNANASATGAGILINGAQDVQIAKNRITGFAGSGGCGINITPTVSAGYTKFRIAGNIIGPNENFTVANETGIKVNAGSFTYGWFAISDNILIGNTNPLTDSSTASAAGQQKVICNNIGLVTGSASLVSTISPVAATETIISQMSIPANSLRVGTTFRISGNLNRVTSDTNATIMMLKLGTAGTTGDGQIMAVTITHTAIANQALHFEMIATCRAIGAGATSLTGTGWAGMLANNTSAAPTAFTVVGSGSTLGSLTSGNNMFLTLTAKHNTANTIDIYNAAIEVIQQ